MSLWHVLNLVRELALSRPAGRESDPGGILPFENLNERLVTRAILEMGPCRHLRSLLRSNSGVRNR
jgi:hypothetical protein